MRYRGIFGAAELNNDEKDRQKKLGYFDNRRIVNEHDIDFKALFYRTRFFRRAIKRNRARAYGKQPFFSF